MMNVKRRKAMEITLDNKISIGRSNNRFKFLIENISQRRLLILLLVCVSGAPCSAFEERRCGTLDIRNHPTKRVAPIGMEKQAGGSIHTNCTVLEGSLLISLIQNDSVTDKDFPRFEHLREITGSLLIFQVKKLTTLAQMFPNLRIIGGQTLIQHYALIIYQNEDLVEIGLPKLRVIRNGGVRIAENSRMCYARYIDWKHLLAGPINDILVDDAVEVGLGEGKIKHCTEDCDVMDESLCRHVRHGQSEKKRISCWNSSTCQTDCPYDRITINGSISSIGPGCADSNFEKCHDECVAGCTVPDNNRACYGCKHYSHEGACVAQCPSHLFAYFDRRCITEAECDAIPPRSAGGSEQNHFKASHGHCRLHCPDFYEEDPSNPKKCRKCTGECHRKCHGNITVDSIMKAYQLRQCSIIEGHLEIEMRVGLDSVGVAQLTEVFGKIHTIDGYLMIRLSSSFINLNIFKSLKVITGSHLYRDKYSVSVFENDNLQKLFPPENKLVVEKGALQFQNNHMLCFSHIKDLMTRIGRAADMTEEDQSIHSNGDKAICEMSTFNLTVDEGSTMQTSFVLRWPALNTSDIDYRKFLGYEILYKEVPEIDPNLSIDDDRSACSDSWFRLFEEEEDVSKEGLEKQDGSNSEVVAIIANDNIKPHTLYAVYVMTKMVRHEGARNAVSSIAFVRTRYGQPDPPRITKIEATDTDKIRVEWDPPAQPNGDITHYILSWRPRDEDVEDAAVTFCQDNRDISGTRYLPSDIDAGLGTTPDPHLASVLISGGSTDIPPTDTCSSIKGCCECSPKPGGRTRDTGSEKQEQAEFENAVHNVVFIQSNENISRRRRSLSSKLRNRRNLTTSRSINKDTIDEIAESVAKAEMDVTSETKKIHVTTTSFTLTGLRHYTNYFISILACQNVSAPEHYCSARKAWKSVRTKPMPDVDQVDNQTIVIKIENGTSSDMRVTWKAPREPNGAVIAYKVKLINTAKQSTPVEKCVSATSDFSSENNGTVFPGVHDGDYRVELYTISLAGMSPPSFTDEIYPIYTPGFWTLTNTLFVAVIFIVFALIVGLVGYFFIKNYYSQKVKEYATQLISANPEYLSQADVYKPDEWELKRSDLTMEAEIGRGTFGKVFRGYGHNVISQCGQPVGVCAIKTVAESANSAERLHFLLEASVMKTFDAKAFIVNLYGVVSDGQPVLVVMEMMEKGNLRDYLRSRRPGAEENVDNLPVPNVNKYYEWASQIADGMAYLESIRFCHRDLAARNCMVHKDETVKIGDFGMARDIYYHEYYKPTGKRLMPVRWMAPESLKDGKFDMKSDVWSYGIVLYEMLTLGQQPYQGLANDEVLSFIGMSRKILERPMDCPDFWYDLMVECWKYSPKDRPTFKQMVEHLLPFASKEFRAASWIVNHPTPDYSTDNEPTYVPEGCGRQILDHDKESNMKFRVDNRANGEQPGWGEGEMFNGVSEAEDAL